METNHKKHNMNLILILKDLMEMIMLVLNLKSHSLNLIWLELMEIWKKVKLFLHQFQTKQDLNVRQDLLVK